MPNRLANETSPYLLQHKDNPVDWYPWCEEAFERAKAEDKPVFLSIGYSACHWCHVMERESFEDKATAALMNESYINIKVDREERPDVDSIYMQAVQALTGHGGWPMSVWLLPDGRPFYGGTYFPDSPRHGMPSFQQVLLRISEIYQEKRDRIENDASRLTSAISGRIMLDNETNQTLTADVLDAAYQQIAQRYDAEWGGFASAPKFPPSMTLELLLRLHGRHGWAQALEMVRYTLDRMARGGMYDQVGGGFHRYSVDRYWLVPHFEKMLYDNALLIRSYLYGYQVTGDETYRRIVEETIEYVRREMASPEGGFYSSQDADSEGQEGKFFVWSRQELADLLPEEVDTDLLLDYWGLEDGPNFEGRSILWVPTHPKEVAHRHAVSVEDLRDQVALARKVLFAAREQRIKPSRDEKVLVSWNALLINSLAQAGRALEEPAYVALAATAADFILTIMRQKNGCLFRSYKDGQSRFNAYLEDYSFLIEALVELYQSTFDARWFDEALQLTEIMVEQFWDDESGFFDTPHNHESLITRPQEVTDNAIPSGTSGAIAALARMAAFTGNTQWREQVERILARLGTAIQQYPQAFSYLACQLEFVTSLPREVVLIGQPDAERMMELKSILFGSYRPNQIVAMAQPGDGQAEELIPLLEGREMVDDQVTAYVCQSFVCKLPVTEPHLLAEQLNAPLTS